MGKVSLRFGGKKYDISLEEKYNDLEEECLKKVFSIDSENDVKDLLHAYLRVCHEKIELQHQMEELLHKLESKLKP